MKFFKANVVFIYLLAFTINVFFISSIYLATKHADLERDIKRIEKSQVQLHQENQNLKIENKINAEKKIFSRKLEQGYKKKTIKEIPIVKIF